MIDQFLTVAYEHEMKHEAGVKLARVLKDLPEEDLRKLASGEAKLAFGACEEWIEKYQGTPLFDQALALEKADLEAEIADVQARSQAPSWETMSRTRDQIRLQKKMLDLELVQLQGSAQGAQQPMSVVSTGAAQGAGAPGDAGPTAGPDVEPTKAASVKQALSNGFIDKAVVNTIAKGALTPDRAQKALSLGQKLVSSGGSPMKPNLGLVRQGANLADFMKKISSPAARFEKAALDMKSVKDLGGSALQWAKQHPTQAGSLVGAVGGAGVGALAGGEDHRLSGALAGAAGGAALGHAAGGIGSGMMRGQGNRSFTDAAKGYGKAMKRSIFGSSGAAKDAVEEAAASTKLPPSTPTPPKKAPGDNFGKQAPGKISKKQRREMAFRDAAAQVSAPQTMHGVAPAPNTVQDIAPPTLVSPETLRGLGATMKAAAARSDYALYMLQEALRTRDA